MILPLVALALSAPQAKPSIPVWWPLAQFVGKPVDDVWPSLKSFAPVATKGQVALTSGDVRILCFSGPQGRIELLNALHLLDHRFIRAGSKSAFSTPDKPTWLNPMGFVANSSDSVGDETVHSELSVGQLVTMATGGAVESSARFFMPSYLVDIDGHSFPGQMELKNTPAGQIMFVVCPLKNGLVTGAVAVSPRDSLYRVTTRFLPSSLTTMVSATKAKIDWKKWAITSLVVAPEEVFKETFPRRLDDGVFRQDLGDFGIYSFRPDANGVPIADPSMTFTATEFRPSEWVKK